MTIEDHYQLACSTPSDINEHLPTLRRYAQQCRHVTEFGVRGVVSTWALLAANPEVLRSYDIADCPVADALAAAQSAGIDFTFAKADTREIVIEPTDLLFIDTLHTAEQLSKELRLHAGKVRKFIILHDTETFGEAGETPGSLGLQSAVDEFLQQCEWWRVRERFTTNNGLTVLECRTLLERHTTKEPW